MELRARLWKPSAGQGIPHCRGGWLRHGGDGRAQQRPVIRCGSASVLSQSRYDGPCDGAAPHTFSRVHLTVTADTFKWTQLSPSGVIPRARAKHAAAWCSASVCGAPTMLISGGEDAAARPLYDVFALNLGTRKGEPVEKCGASHSGTVCSCRT